MKYLKKQLLEGFRHMALKFHEKLLEGFCHMALKFHELGYSVG